VALLLGVCHSPPWMSAVVQHSRHSPACSTFSCYECCNTQRVWCLAVFHRLVVVSFSLLMLGLHYFACALWLVLRVQVGKESCRDKRVQHACHNHAQVTPCVYVFIAGVLITCEHVRHNKSGIAHQGNNNVEALTGTFMRHSDCVTASCLAQRTTVAPLHQADCWQR